MRNCLLKPISLLIGFFLCVATLSAQVPGNCLSFDGANDLVACGTQNPTRFTVEAWVNPNIVNSDRAVVSTLTTIRNMGMELHIGADAKCYVTIKNSAGWLDVGSSNVLVANKWYHLAATFDGATVKVYVNGVLSGSVASVTYTPSDQPLFIGQRNSGGNNFNGKIDEVRHWNIALTQAQIQQNIANELTGSESGLLSYYKFNQQSGTTLTDAKSSYNGTLINFALSGSTSNWTTSFVLSATNISNSDFTANWQAIDMATKYRIDVSDRLDFSNLIASNIDAGIATSYCFTGLTLNTGTTYYYRVRYESANGTSSNSLPVSFITSPNNAISFDGTNDYIAVPLSTSGWTGWNDLTIETWINLSQAPSTNGYGIFNNTWGVNGNVHFQINLEGIIFAVYGAYSPWPTLLYTFTPNTWYHIAVTYRATEAAVKFYINGALQQTSTLTNPQYINITNGASIGGWAANGSRYFKGMMDEYRIWGKVKTQAEIQSQMNKELTGTEAYLGVYYKFNQGISTANNSAISTVTDASSFALNGTLTNFSLIGATSNFATSTAIGYIKDATNITNSGFTANWFTVTDATVYLIDVDDNADFSSPISSNINAGTGTSFAVTGLTFTTGKNYYYRMRYTCASGTSAYSESKLVKAASGNALSFDCDATAGTYNDYVNLGTVSPSGNFSTGFTYMGWVKWDAFQSWSRLFDMGTGTGYNNILLANNGTTGNLNLSNYVGTTQYTITSGSALPLNQWVHVAATITSTGLGTIYVNGQNVGMANVGIPSNIARNLSYLGRSNWGDAYFKGSMDEVSFWTRALSADEIHGYMNAPLTGSETGLYIYYNFNHGLPAGTNAGITTLTDALSHNNGTLNNFALTGAVGNFVSSGATCSPYIYEATNVTTTGFTANWKSVPGATAYRIDVSDRGDFSSLLQGNIDAGSSTTFNVTGLNLTIGSNYYYRMRSIDANGTSSNSATKTFMVATGNSLSFDGSNDYVSVPQLATGLTDVTIECWINRDAMNSSLVAIYAVNTWTTGTPHLNFYTDNRLAFAIGSHTPEAVYFDYSFKAGIWYHVAATYHYTSTSSATVKLYVNGSLVTTSSYSTAYPINLNAACLGTYYSNGRNYNGKMDNFRIWGKALTITDIKTSMDTDVVGNEANLLVSYNFNQGVANNNNSVFTNLPDATGTNNGTLTNFALTGTASNYTNGSSIYVYYVDASAATGGNGLTPATAFNTLPAAFSAATGCDTIKVAAGTYYQPASNMSLTNKNSSLTLLGGYNSDFTIRDTVSKLTIISGVSGATYPIISITNGNFTIDGFTLKNGVGSTSTLEGGAIRFYVNSTAYNCNLKVSNCNFVSNKTTSGNGGALFVLSQNSLSNANVTNCTFDGNIANGYGGAIATAFTTFTISNCTFINNIALNAGGALYFDRNSAVITNNTLYNNSAAVSSGAIWISGAAITLTQNTIVGNFNTNTSGAGAIYCNSGIMNLQGNIIAGNFSKFTGLYAYDVWQEYSIVDDNGYNIFGINSAFQFHDGVNANSIIIPNGQLYQILDTIKNSTITKIDTSVRLFPAKVAYNGGVTPTIKINSKYFKSIKSNVIVKNIRQVPAIVGAFTMPNTDQRGNARTMGAACIGSFEMNASDKYIYVNKSFAAGGNGSQSYPFNELDTALSKATVYDTIKVAAGDYIAPSTSFVITKNVTLIGGYNAAFTLFDPKTNITTIKYDAGTGSVPLIKINNTSAELNGFTIKNSQSTSKGGGILVDISTNISYDVILKNCLFTNNTASSGNGGGICFYSTSTVSSLVSISNCTFTGNTTSAYGGALAITGHFNINILNSTFSGNTATLNAGAIYQGTGGTLRIQQTTIVGNKCTTSTAGGGIDASGTLNLIANIIAGNYSGAARHDIYMTGNIYDWGYNLIGDMGTTAWYSESTSDSIKTADLYNLLKCDTSGTGHVGSYKADRLFYAGVAFNGGYTPTIQLLKTTYKNALAATKNINIVPKTTGVHNLDVLDQRGVNRVVDASCIGSFEYRDTLQTKGIIADVLSSNSAHIHFTPGSFSKRLVFIKNGTTSNAIPENGVSYTSDDEFGKGSQIGTSGWYCVYNGSDTMVSITGLRPVQKYFLKAFEYNDISNYYTDLSKVVGKNNPISITTPKMNQTININLEPKKWGDGNFSIQDTTSLGLSSIKYISSNLSVATITSNTIHIVGVGSSVISANQDGNDTISASPEVKLNFLVNADTLFITASNTTSLYGETPAFNFTSSGLKNNDSIIAKVGVTYTTIANDTSYVGDYNVTPSSVVFASGRGVASNYILKYITGKHSIHPNVLVIKADNKTKTFGDGNPSFTQTPAGLKKNDVITVTYMTPAIDLSNAGTYDIVPSNALFTKGSTTNYNIQYEKGTLTIAPAEVSVKATDTSKVYGTNNPAFKYKATGLRSPDAIGNVTYNTPANDSSIVGSYTITPSNALFSVGNSINYAIVYNTGNLNITKSQLTITAKDTSKLYGDLNPINYAYKVAGLKFSDKMGSVAFTTSVNQSSIVGSYDLVPDGATLSVGSENYNLNYIKGTFVVNKAPVTITANNATKVYGSINPSFSYSPAGLKLTDSIVSISYTCLANSTSKVGSYNITPSGIIFKPDVANNYTVTYSDGSLSITQAPLTIKAEDKSRQYFSKSNPDFTVKYIGFVNSETEAVLTTKPLLNCTATKTSIPGTYPISVSWASAANYDISYTDGTLTVSESPIQICLISVDLETGKNMVIWERQRGLDIKKYNVYRENTELNNYESIGSLPFNKEGVLVDITSKPEEQQYRYKISAIDSSGNESVLSNYHQPMFLQHNGNENGVNLIWEPYTIENGTMLFKSYKLFRGTDSTNLALLITLPSSNTMYIDKDATALKYRMYYRLIGVLNSACNSQSLLKAGGGPFVESVSNLEDNRLRFTNSINGVKTNCSMSIYPNPACNYLMVNYSLKEASNVQFELCNLLGESICSINVGQTEAGKSTYRIDIAHLNLQNGIYYLRLKAKNENEIKKIVISN
jgi:hypothetical protein